MTCACGCVLCMVQVIDTQGRVATARNGRIAQTQLLKNETFARASIILSYKRWVYSIVGAQNVKMLFKSLDRTIYIAVRMFVKVV